MARTPRRAIGAGKSQRRPPRSLGGVGAGSGQTCPTTTTCAGPAPSGKRILTSRPLCAQATALQLKARPTKGTRPGCCCHALGRMGSLKRISPTRRRVPSASPTAYVCTQTHAHTHAHPRAGVKECSPLNFYPFWDMVWDILADMMHIITGIFKRHICALLRGLRTPAAVKARKKNTAEQNKELAHEHKKAVAMVKSWALDKVGPFPVSRTMYTCGLPVLVRVSALFSICRRCSCICRHIV